MNRRTTTSRRTRARRPARATRRTAPWTTSCSWRSSTRSACCPPKCTPPSNPSRPRKCTSTQVRHSGNLHHGQWLVVHTTSNCCNGSISENKKTSGYEFALNGFHFELSSNYGLSRENKKTTLTSLYPTNMTYEIDSCAKIKKEISYQDPKIFINLNREYRK